MIAGHCICITLCHTTLWHTAYDTASGSGVRSGQWALYHIHSYNYVGCGCGWHTTKCLVERCVGEERVHHGESLLRLVQRHHVAGVADLQEGEVGRGAGLPGGVTSNNPIVVSGGVEFVVVVPGHSETPGLVAEPVADEVNITSVDQHADSEGQQAGHVGFHALHPVISESTVDGEVARGPSARRIDTESLFGGVEAEEIVNIGEIVAQRLDFAGLADVVRVQSSLFVRSNEPLVAHGLSDSAGRGVVLALLDQVNAWLHVTLHGLVSFEAHGGLLLHGDGPIVGHFGVVLVLDLGVGQTVTNTDTDKVERLAEAVRGGRGVVSAVAFAENEEVVGLQNVIIGLAEGVKEMVHVLRNTGFVVHLVAAVAVAEADAGRLVDEDHRGVRVPGVGVDVGL